MLIVNSYIDNCPFLNVICWDWHYWEEKGDDTDDVEIERFLEDSNFENGKDKCEVVIAWIVLAQILWLVLPNFAILVFWQFS